MYYELHITMQGNATDIRKHVEAIGWKYSCIEDDIILGKGHKSYATIHYPAKRPFEEVMTSLMDAVNALFIRDVDVLRRKIELVLHDVKL